MKKKLLLVMGIIATTGMVMTGCGTNTAETGVVSGAVGSGIESAVDAIEETADEDDAIEEETVMDEFETSENTEPEPTAEAPVEDVPVADEAITEESDVDQTETAGEMVDEEIVTPEGEESTEVNENEVELPTDYTDGNTEGTILGKQMKKAADGMKKFINKAGN